ncbi:hypothetical protein [Actinomadura miaoliensis]|uniref:Uncharacterized protein n=1 Tax=Actinomadura miaoliensis TaxID=430685 RepID=A0ABP7W261_9ACTN
MDQRRQAERAQLEADLRGTTPPEPVSTGEIAELPERVGDLAQTAATAGPDDKAELYRELGLRKTFHHQNN